MGEGLQLHPTPVALKPGLTKISVALFAIILTLLPSGCTRKTALPPASKIQVWGRQGAGADEFTQPRAITVAPNGFVYIADTTGRILKWTDSGKYVTSWQTPKLRNDLPEGPEGITVLRDGNIAFSNTHASMVFILTPEGKEVRRFGSYGTKPGQFLLVTGVTSDADGFIYCADYGGELDRISKWTKEGKLVAAWQGHGEGPRQFRRPCGLAISKEGDLLVADVGNGRIQRIDRNTGAYKGVIGKRGRGDGELNYPFGVAVDGIGNIYTVEYGGHRVQKFSADGKWLASFGGPGRAAGKFANPRGIAVGRDGAIYVTDTMNHRVQKFRF